MNWHDCGPEEYKPLPTLSERILRNLHFFFGVDYRRRQAIQELKNTLRCPR